MTKIKIIDYEKKYLPDMIALFADTIQKVNCRDYSPEQISAWINCADYSRWGEEFEKRNTLIALCGEKVAGFADMTEDGYLDRLYVSADFQRQKVATTLLQTLENRVSAREYSTHASITALPFFLAQGYRAVCENKVERGGIVLCNYTMTKRL